MSVRVNSGGGASGGGLSNLMSLYGTYNQIAGMGGGGGAPAQGGYGQTPDQPQGDPFDNQNVAGQRVDSGLGTLQAMNQAQDGMGKDPFLDNLDAMKRRQSTMVSAGQPSSKGGLSNVMGMIGAMA